MIMMRIVTVTVSVLLILIGISTVPAHAAFTECEDVSLESLTPDADCLAAVEANLEPSVIDIPQDRYTLSTYTYWKVTASPAPVFDAPGGSITRQIESGFNFVKAVDTTSVAGWVQILGGEWMPADTVSLYEPSYFSGVTLLNPLDRPFAWVMFDLFPASEPGGQQDPDTERLIMRYERVNVFAKVNLDGWDWYMVGPNQWVEQRWVAVAKRVERPEGVEGRWVAVDLYEQTMVAYENDIPVFATIVSTGLPNSDTREGLFTVWARVDVGEMSGFAGAPNSYALQGVPWTMYFDGDISLHGTYWHDGFGYRHSRGCVNLSISDARYLYEWTGGGTPDENGDIFTHVYVYSSGDYAGQGELQA